VRSSATPERARRKRSVFYFPGLRIGTVFSQVGCHAGHAWHAGECRTVLPITGNMCGYPQAGRPGGHDEENHDDNRRDCFHRVANRREHLDIAR